MEETLAPVPEETGEVKKRSLFANIFGMMINPAGTIKGAVAGTRWYVSLLISALAFSLFFVQTGLDLYKTGQKGMGFVWFSLASGALYGLLVIPLIAVVAWGILKMAGTDRGVTWAVSGFCLSYSSALIYGLLGIIFSLMLGWKTAIAFGVSGVLWAVGPLIVASREMTEGNLKVSIPLVTVFSALVLLSWSFFGQL